MSLQMGQRVIDQAGQQDNQTDLTEEERRAVDTILHMLGEKQRRLVVGVVSQISLKDSHLAGHEYEKWDFMRRENYSKPGCWRDSRTPPSSSWWPYGKQSSEGCMHTMTCQQRLISNI